MRIPDALSGLADVAVWVAWNDEGRRKVPKSPHGGNAKTNDPSTWGTYAEASDLAERRGYSGVGVMLSDGLVGIDLDHVIGEDGEVEQWARELVDGIGSYAERSPSGTGVHVLAYARPEEVGRVGRANHADGIEVYNNRRYFTVTGDVVSDNQIRDVTKELPDIVARYFAGPSPDELIRRAVGDMAADQTRRMANRTMTRNAERDGYGWARVPVGDTCGWCLMLASRGFAYGSERSAGGEGNKYHDGCNCEVIPGFPGIEVEGYDPDALYDVYDAAYKSLGGRSGLRDTWSTLADEDRARRIERHDGSESEAFDAYCEEQIGRRIETDLYGSPRNGD